MAVSLVSTASPVAVDSTGTLWSSYDFQGASLAVVLVSADGGSDQVTSVSINGTAMSLSHRTANTGGGFTGRAAFHLVNPTNGNVTCVIAVAKNHNWTMLVFSGVDTTTPLGTWVETGDQASDTATTGTITGGDASGMFIAHMSAYFGSGPITWQGTLTARAAQHPLYAATKAGSSSTTVGGTVTSAIHTNVAGVYIRAEASTTSIAWIKG